MNKKRTREPQYQAILDKFDEKGLEGLGLMTSQAWDDDPKRLAFTLSRYKFAAKMLGGQNRVLEVGCADAFGTRIVRQEVKELTAVDFDPVFVADVNRRMREKWRFKCFVHDLLASPVPGRFDAVYALDVLEHIEPKVEAKFLKNLCRSLTVRGVALIGMPSLESQRYASPISKAGHVNCKTMPELKNTMARHFHHVFMFSMNDEVIHTGYHKMAHYLMALCAEPKR
jgi:2-polyprenyl-3-methyl-5-hydroxy-6-metoxy-1,4-benzoquinol methylase